MQGKAVKEFRHRHSLSANKLSVLLGIDRQTIYNWEAEKNDPPPYLKLALDQIEATMPPIPRPADADTTHAHNARNAEQEEPI